MSTTKEYDADCICKGNWRAIISAAQPLLDKRFKDGKGNEYIFYGVVHGSDDFYYGMIPVCDGKPILLSCVGSLEGHGFTVMSEDKAPNLVLAPFNLNDALSGHPVVQRNGMRAKMHKVDEEGVIVALMVLEDINGDGSEIVESEILATMNKQGRYKPDLGESGLDLFMAI